MATPTVLPPSRVSVQETELQTGSISVRQVGNTVVTHTAEDIFHLTKISFGNPQQKGRSSLNFLTETRTESYGVKMPDSKEDLFSTTQVSERQTVFLKDGKGRATVLDQQTLPPLIMAI